jgi:hypothetical protein
MLVLLFFFPVKFCMVARITITSMVTSSLFPFCFFVFAICVWSLFPYPKGLIIWNIQTHFIPNESYNKRIFIYLFIYLFLWSPFFQRILIIANIQTHFILDGSYNKSVCLFAWFFFWMCKCVSNLETKGENTRVVLIFKKNKILSLSLWVHHLQTTFQLRFNASKPELNAYFHTWDELNVYFYTSDHHRFL